MDRKSIASITDKSIQNVILCHTCLEIVEKSDLYFMKVEVIYINSNSEFIKNLEVAENASVEEAIHNSGVLREYPEISLGNNRVGIFNELVSLDAKLNANDRIEIYRPLKLDPMEARRMRAKI